MRKDVGITFGGAGYEVTPTIGLAVAIENATGKPVLTLGVACEEQRALINDAVAVIRVALNGSGVPFTQEKCLDKCMVEGIVATQRTAALIIAALFVRDDAPAKAKGKNRPLVEPTVSQ